MKISSTDLLKQTVLIGQAVIMGLVISESVFASRPNINPGSSLTSGPGSNEHSLFAGAFNPAMGMLMVGENEKWRLGYLPSIATELELGKVDDFSNEVEDLIDIIDDPLLTKDSVEVTLNRFNTVLPKMGKEGYLKNTTGIYFPLFYRNDFLGGAINFDLSYEIQAAARVLDDPLFFNPQNMSFSTNTSVYLKSGIEKTLSLSYSRVISDEMNPLSTFGKLYAGARVSWVSLDLSKQVIWLEGVDNGDLEDIIRDEYDRNLTSNQKPSIDLGIVFDSAEFRIGLTITNINSPAFDYNQVGTACETKPTPTVESSNCYVAKYFVENKKSLKAAEIHQKKPLATVDTTLKLSEKWRLMGSYDLAEYNDVVGFENQMFNLATSYETSGYWIPSPRFGYQTNLAKNGLSSLSLGFTFFKVLTLDIAKSSEEVTIDNSTVPRYLSASLGFEEKF
jgi:hypothetical protein